MSLDHILLGMLRDPASGYDLHRAFEEGPRHFWSAELGQIYPALNRMEESGLLTSRTTPSARGPARRVYRRTAAGTRALHRWLRGEADVGAERLAWIGQLIFLGELRDPKQTRRLLGELRAHFVAGQMLLRDAEQSLRADHASVPPEQWPDDEFHELLCVRMGVHVRNARVDACDECIRLVEARARSSASGRGRRS